MNVESVEADSGQELVHLSGRPFVCLGRVVVPFRLGGQAKGEALFFVLQLQFTPKSQDH